MSFFTIARDREYEGPVKRDTLKQKKPAVKEVRDTKDDEFWLLGLYFLGLYIASELEDFLGLWRNVQTKGK